MKIHGREIENEGIETKRQKNRETEGERERNRERETEIEKLPEVNWWNIW